MAAQVVQAPLPSQAPAAQAAGHSMQVVVPFQTRGAVQQLATLVHVRQLVALVSQVAHGAVHATQLVPVKAYPGEQQLDVVRQLRQSPVLVHEPAKQVAGHVMQLVLPSHTRGDVQQSEALVHVRQLVALVSQVAHGAVHGVQVVGAV